MGMVCYARANARSVVVEHAFGPEAEFTHRGYMELLVDPSLSTPPSATLPPVELSEAHRLQDLIAKDGLYLIRVSTDDKSTNHVVAAISACHLRLSSFREEMTLHVEGDGLIVGLDYKAPVGPLASTRDCTKMPVPESSQLFTNIKVVRAASAHSVPLQAVANSPPPGLMNLKENIATQDPKTGNQSFLVKYWYVFIPLVLSWMFTAGPPEQGPAGGASGPATGTSGSTGSGGAR